jgi:hypothetical protein
MEQKTEDHTAAGEPTLTDSEKAYAMLAELMTTTIGLLSFNGPGEKDIADAVETACLLHGIGTKSKDAVMRTLASKRLHILNTHHAVGTLNEAENGSWMNAGCACMRCQILLRAKLSDRPEVPDVEGGHVLAHQIRKRPDAETVTDEATKRGELMHGLLRNITGDDSSSGGGLEQLLNTLRSSGIEMTIINANELFGPPESEG